MRKKWFLWGGAVVLVYVVGVAVTIFVSINRVPDFHSSPTEKRDSHEFKSGSMGVLEPARRSRSVGWPADTEWAIPIVVPGEDGDFLLEWRNEPKTEEREEREQPERWVEELQGDDEIDLVAFASWVPQPDDDFNDPDWQATPVFRDAKTLEILSGEDLDGLGIPEEFRRLTPPKEYRSPKLRLLFRSKNMEYVRFFGGEGGDLRTGAAVTYNLDRLGEDEPMFRQIGDWTRLDFALLLWHDTPIKLYVQVLTGEPEVATLEQSRGAQVAFDDHLRVQWVRRATGEIDVDEAPSGFVPASTVSSGDQEAVKKRGGDPGHQQVWVQFEEEDEPNPEEEETTSVMLRVNSSDYIEGQCGWVRASGEVDWYWDYIGFPDTLSGKLMTPESPLPNPDQPIQLVFLPKIAELEFELGGLPDLPNPRAAEDLFDVRIPRLTVAENPGSAEGHLFGFLSVAAEVEWDYTALWGDNPPAELPEDRTFRNMSPQELLVWYKEVTPEAKIRYDEKAKKIYFNEERESWWDAFKEKLSSLRYWF